MSIDQINPGTPVQFNLTVPANVQAGVALVGAANFTPAPGALGTDDITNDSGVAGATCSDAIDQVAADSSAGQADLKRSMLTAAQWAPVGLLGVQKPVRASNLPAGATTLYTCPVGKRAFFRGRAQSWNRTGLAIAAEGKLVSGGTYKIGSTITTNAGATALLSLVPSIIVLDAGESIEVVTNNPGLNVFTNVIEFDPADSDLFTAKVVVANGNNTLYQCSIGRTGFIAGGQNGASVYVGNETVSNITVAVHLVASGGSPDDDNKVDSQVVVANGGISVYTVPISFEAGDSIVLVSSGAGGLAYVAMQEV